MGSQLPPACVSGLREIDNVRPLLDVPGWLNDLLGRLCTRQQADQVKAIWNQIADAFEAFDRDMNIRSYVLCAQGKSFCAGADFANRPQTGAAESGKHLYKEATRLFRARKPSVAAVQGPAIGGGRCVLWAS